MIKKISTIAIFTLFLFPANHIYSMKRMKSSRTEKKKHTNFRFILAKQQYDEKPENVKSYRFKDAISQEKHSRLLYILRKGNSPNTNLKRKTICSEENDTYPLDIASKTKNLIATHLLLNFGANPNLGSIFYNAIYKQNPFIIGLLLHAGIQEDILNRDIPYAAPYRLKANAPNDYMQNTTEFAHALLWDALKKKRGFKRRIKNLLANEIEKEKKYKKKTHKKKRIKITWDDKEKIDSLIRSIKKYPYTENKKRSNLLKKISRKIQTIDIHKINIYNIDRLDGIKAIHIIAAYMPQYINFFLKKGLYPNPRTIGNLTPAHIIFQQLPYPYCCSSETKITTGLIALLEHGANPCIVACNSKNLDLTNRRSTFGSLWELALPHLPLFTILAKHADLTCSNPETGKTGLHQICYYDAKGIIPLVEMIKVMLTRLGDNIDQQDFVGMTALHHAVIFKNETLIKLFLEYKADPTKKCSFGYSSLDILESLWDNNKIVKNKYRRIKELLTAN